MAYCDPTDIEGHLGRSLTTQEAATTGALINAAKGYIDRRASRTFELVTANTGKAKYFDTGSLVDPYMDPYDLGESVEPRNKFIPIHDVQPGSVDTTTGVALVNEQGTEYFSMQQGIHYQWYPLDAVDLGTAYTSIFRVYSTWPAGYRGIRITGDWCYTTEAGDDVRTAAALIVCHYLRNKGDLLKETIEGYERQFKPTAPVPGMTRDPYLDAIVDQYVPKRVRVYAG